MQFFQMRPSDISTDPLPVMESHEIELLECAGGLGSAGTNRQGFFFYLQNPSLADKRVLASDPEQLPSRRSLHRWECAAGAAAAVAGEKKNRTKKQGSNLCQGRDPRSECILPCWAQQKHLSACWVFSEEACQVYNFPDPLTDVGVAEGGVAQLKWGWVAGLMGVDLAWCLRIFKEEFHFIYSIHLKRWKRMDERQQKVSVVDAGSSP